MRIGLDIDLPQIFVQFGQGHLDRRFHRVDINGRQMFSRRAAGHRELIGKHERHEFRQHAVFRPKDILKGTVRNIGFLYDLRHGRLFVAFLQKELDADRQNPFFRGQTYACDRHMHPSVSFWCVYQNYSIAGQQMQAETDSFMTIIRPLT